MLPLLQQHQRRGVLALSRTRVGSPLISSTILSSASPYNSANSLAVVPLELLPSHAPDVLYDDAVQQFLALESGHRKAASAALGSLSPTSLDDQLNRVVAASRNARAFLESLRMVTSTRDVAALGWARKLDAAACRAMRVVYSPACTALLQLGFGGAATPADARLVDTALSLETVHASSDSDAVARKFGTRRMVHALVHERAPESILAILYSALLPGMPASMQQIDAMSGAQGGESTGGKWLLEPGALSGATSGGVAASRRPNAQLPATTAAFYSVSSPHLATRGLRLGTRIIYSVAALIAAAAPGVSMFCTLSPVPDFVGWIVRGAADGSLDRLLLPHERGSVTAAARAVMHIDDRAALQLSESNTSATLAHVLSSDSHAWFHNGVARAQLQPLLCRLFRYYLLDPVVSTGSAGDTRIAVSSLPRSTRLLQQPRCKVTRFHLGNGAQLSRLCWGADPSPAGLARSAGLMVNYVYSDCGSDGLSSTMRERAWAYATDPGRVLAEQHPVWA